MITIQREFQVSTDPKMKNCVRRILDDGLIDIIDETHKKSVVNCVLYEIVVFYCLANEDQFKAILEALDEDEGIHAVVTY